MSLSELGGFIVEQLSHMGCGAKIFKIIKVALTRIPLTNPSITTQK